MMYVDRSQGILAVISLPTDLDSSGRDRQSPAEKKTRRGSEISGRENRESTRV